MNQSRFEHEQPIGETAHFQTPQPKKRRRRFLQFSLRMFLLAVLFVSAWLGWYVYRAQNQKRLIQRVKDAGGSVSYEFELTKEGFRKKKNFVPPGPEWLRNAVGIDFLATVRSVKFSRPDSDITPASELPGLKFIRIDSDDVDFSLLSSCRELTRLETATKTFSNIDALAKLPRLRDVLFFSPNLKDVNPFVSFPSLERLAFQSSQVKDLSPLAKLTKVKSINLLFMNGRDGEFDALTRQLPNCEVIRQDRPFPQIPLKVKK